MKQVVDINNLLNSEFSGLAFYGEQASQHPAFFPSQKCGYQTYPEPMVDITQMNNTCYTQMTDCSEQTQPYQVLNAYQNEKNCLDAFENQVKMEFDEYTGQQYNTQGFVTQSQSMSDIRTYAFDSSYQNQTELSFTQRSKSLSHPSSPHTSSITGESPKATTKSSSSSSIPTKKESSRPRMYKFNPKPLTVNPSMKRIQTPCENKNVDYWDKRKKNNDASRRSRLARRLKECMVMEEMKKLKKENEELRAELSKLQNSANTCRV